MKVWVDDVRPAPEGWMLATTPQEAIDLLQAGEVEVISLDHDLGYDGKTELTGYEVALWIEEAVALNGFKPPTMLVHSANPPGHERLLRAIKADQPARREGLGTPTVWPL